MAPELFLALAPLVNLRLENRGYLAFNYSNVDFLCAGAQVYNANLHVRLPFFLVYFCFAAARSLALRARGLKTNSWSLPVSGRLVSSRKLAS